MSFRPFREPLASELDARRHDEVIEPAEGGLVSGAATVPQEAVSQEACRRCRKPYPVSAAKCPACGSANPACRDFAPPAALEANDLGPLNIVMATFGIMLLLSVAFMVALASSPTLQGAAIEQRLFVISILEVVDTLVVAVAGVLLLRVSPPSDATRPVTAWLVAGPALLGALAINIAYHTVVRSLGIPVHELPIDAADSRLALWALATICIQPALVEEWFFRGIVWKSFRRYLGVHGTVWVVAVMFGMAHIGAFLSVPVLILIGGLLGYARLYSGGLALPIALHFLHNLLISLWEMAQ